MYQLPDPRTLPPANPAFAGDAAALAARLTATVKGEVRFDTGSRALYATDSSNYRQVPIGVVIPRDADDIMATVAACREFGAPVLARGAGTSLAGQCCNVAVVMDCSKYYNAILELDPERMEARVQPGVVLDRLRERAEAHHLTFAPDPATHRWCSIGGMIGNNSCGAHSVMAGKTDDNINALEVLTYDGLRMHVGPTSPEELEAIIQGGGRRGEIYAGLKAIRDKYADAVRTQFPRIPRRVSGYNLDFLLPENGFHVARALVGSEGTCVTVLEATTRLVHSPQGRALLVIGFHDVYAAADAVPLVSSFGPIGLEGVDAMLVSHSRKKGLNLKGIALLPDGEGWLYAEFGGETVAEAETKARALMAVLQREPRPPAMTLYRDKAETELVWAVRETALGATSFVPGEKKNWEGWEDAAVEPAKLGGYLRDLRAMMNRYGYKGCLYGHFGQGCVHTRIDFDLYTPEGIAVYRRFVEEAADLVVKYGGSISGEHGDGQARGELLSKMYGPDLMDAFRQFKLVWDPLNRMNPGKLIDPYRLDEHIRIVQYHPTPVETHFSFPKEGSFKDAATRCVGVGKCRKTDGGAMCPSYQATGEERYATRGRARLLYEMMQGEVITDGFNNEDVHESLDLCLSCKSCKTECPVGVDMATYKAEFLSHYHETHPRKLRSYAFGHIDRLAAMAEYIPAVANFFMTTPPFSQAIKWLIDVAPSRTLPVFAAKSFRRLFVPKAATPGARTVMLWVDTSNNYFHPDVSQAAVEVLEAAGFHVEIPKQRLCCGRPLYDHGMLDSAKQRLREILEALAPQIAAGTPIVGLEPSCVAVFRDEMLSLFPDDARATALGQQVFLLSEFLEREHALPELRLQGKALVHPHCHHRAVMGIDGEIAVMKRLGVDFTVLDAGCCGMAGAFGFSKEHVDTSVAIGERVLLPAVREAGADDFIVANGFSCGEQIQQTTGRRVWHLSQILREALRRSGRGARPGA